MESVSLAHHQQDLRVTVLALGWWPNGRFQPLADDIASVAYWYQREPHAGFAAVSEAGAVAEVMTGYLRQIIMGQFDAACHA